MSSVMKRVCMKSFKMTVNSSLSLGFKQLAGIFWIAAIAGGMVSPVIAGDGECVRPELIGSVGSATLLNFAHDAVLDGDLAYLVGRSTGLQIVDMSDPTQPVVVEVHDTVGAGARVKGIDVKGGYLYIADGDSGLLIYDLNDLPTSTLYQTPLFSASDVEVVGDIAYVTYSGIPTQDSGVEILDVSDPTSPIFLGSFITDGFAREVTVEGTTVYVSDSDNGLVILDASDPSLPQLLGTFPTSGSLRTDAVIVGNTAFVVSFFSESFQIIDVSDPTSPALLGELDGVLPSDIAVFGDIAIAGGRLTNMILDVSVFSNPTKIVSFPTTFSFATFLDMDTALLMRGNGVRVFDISGELGGDCPPYCQVDMNADGELNFFDVSLFLQAYIARDPVADFTGTGSVDFHDISAFLVFYQAGCP
jgi:hypothetical protein